MEKTKVQFIDDKNVKVLTEKNDTVLNMSSKTFESLQKIINGDYETVKDLDTTEKKIFNVEKTKDDKFQFESSELNYG